MKLLAQGMAEAAFVQYATNLNKIEVHEFIAFAKVSLCTCAHSYPFLCSAVLTGLIFVCLYLCRTTRHLCWPLFRSLLHSSTVSNRSFWSWPDCFCVCVLY